MKDKGLILLAVGQTLSWAGVYYVFPSLLVSWEADLGWSKTQITAAITLAIMLSALVSPLVGRLIDKGYGAYVLCGATVLGGLMIGCLSLVNELWHFYFIWGVVGVAIGGCLYDPCFSLITRSRGSKAKQPIIFITLIAGFAGTISFPAAYGLTEMFGWRAAVLVFGAVVVLFAAPMMWFGARRVERDALATAPEIANERLPNAFLRSKAFWFLGIGLAFMAVTHSAVIHHLLPILQSRGVGLDVAVIVAAFIGPMQVAGRLAMMLAEKRVSNHAVASACFLVVSISVLGLIFASDELLLLAVFIVLFGGGYGVVSIIRPVVARDILGQANFGAKSGALSMPYLIGTAIAPYLASLVWRAGGYDALLILLTVIPITGFVLYRLAHQAAK